LRNALLNIIHTMAAAAEESFKQNEWVIIQDLQSAAELNGRCGRIDGPITETGRYPVGVDLPTGGTRAVNVKPANMRLLADAEYTKAVRINCDGEIGKLRRGRCSDMSFPRVHSMFSKAPKQGMAPVCALLGVPLMIIRQDPDVKLAERSHYDNQWTTWFMIDVESGFAPAEWQAYIGPTLLYRPGGADFTPYDCALLNDAMSTLLDKFGAETINQKEHMTPAWFQGFKRRRTEGSRAIAYNI
jgi:hypothetical protein